jgi:hypothetical protein
MELWEGRVDGTWANACSKTAPFDARRSTFGEVYEEEVVRRGARASGDKNHDDDRESPKRQPSFTHVAATHLPVS